MKRDDTGSTGQESHDHVVGMVLPEGVYKALGEFGSRSDTMRDIVEAIASDGPPSSRDRGKRTRATFRVSKARYELAKEQCKKAGITFTEAVVAMVEAGLIPGGTAPSGDDPSPDGDAEDDEGARSGGVVRQFPATGPSRPPTSPREDQDPDDF